MWVCVGLCVYVCECCVYVRTFECVCIRVCICALLCVQYLAFVDFLKHNSPDAG